MSTPLPRTRPEQQSGYVGGNGYPCRKQRLNGGFLRQVTAKRKRALERKGQYVWWSMELGWYLWKMPQPPKKFTDNERVTAYDWWKTLALPEYDRLRKDSGIEPRTTQDVLMIWDFAGRPQKEAA